MLQRNGGPPRPPLFLIDCQNWMVSQPFNQLIQERKASRGGRFRPFEPPPSLNWLVTDARKVASDICVSEVEIHLFIPTHWEMGIWGKNLLGQKRVAGHYVRTDKENAIDYKINRFLKSECAHYGENDVSPILILGSGDGIHERMTQQWKNYVVIVANPNSVHSRYQIDNRYIVKHWPQRGKAIRS